MAAAGARGVTVIPQKSSDFIIQVILLVMLMVCLAICLAIYFYYIWRSNRSKLQSKQHHPFTDYPRFPEWIDVKQIVVTSSEKKPIKLYRPTKDHPIHQTYKSIEALGHLRDCLIEIFDERVYFCLNQRIKVIQIPAKHFKCSRDCGMFEPLSGISEGSFFKYQIIGNFAMQATYYVENEVSSFAGLTIFIGDRGKKSYDKEIIRNLLNSPEYWPTHRLLTPEVEEASDYRLKEEVIKTRNEIGILSKHSFSEDQTFVVCNINSEMENRSVRNIGNSLNMSRLRGRFCYSTGEVVTVGWMNGTMFHVEWNDGRFKMIECEGCVEEEPPMYSTFEISE